MNGAGGECGKRLTLFDTGLLACSGSACGGILVGLTGNAVVRGLKQGMGAGIYLCACGELGAIGALASAFKGGDYGGLTKFNCPGMLDL